ncbi:jg26957 [Pararge aegeria aegeria]|uniref:Jg26957 protein n=1 Tax=Pararge aegeria aegeria TaxID=348720 RepID=A0A8S4RTH1_9NEOP|nr:jg26957 [Pararge aegeria aegeria]
MHATAHMWLQATPTGQKQTQGGVGLITEHSSLNGHLSIIGVTDSPLCRACVETDETPTHVMLECTGVAEQHEATFPEVLSNLGGMLGFLNELGWLSDQQWEISTHKKRRKNRRGDACQCQTGDQSSVRTIPPYSPCWDTGLLVSRQHPPLQPTSLFCEPQDIPYREVC